MLGTVLVILLVLILLGGIGPYWTNGAPWSYGYGLGHGGISIVGVVLIVLVILLVTGRL